MPDGMKDAGSLRAFDGLSPLVPRTEIKAAIRRLARSIERDYAQAAPPPVLIGALKGAAVFLSELAAELRIPFEKDFLQASSYGTRDAPSPAPVILRDMETDIKGRHVILVEDIIDRGVTLDALTAHIMAKGPASLRVCTLLLRETEDRGARTADYAGIRIGKGFVVGYGMDYKERYRELPDIYDFDDVKEGTEQ